MRTLIMGLIFTFISTATYSQTQDSAKNKNESKTTNLNGYYTLYNKMGQKSKVGTFKDNRLMDGRNYIYDDKYILVRIELYKDFKYTGDTTDK